MAVSAARSSRQETGLEADKHATVTKGNPGKGMRNSNQNEPDSKSSSLLLIPLFSYDAPALMASNSRLTRSHASTGGEGASETIRRGGTDIQPGRQSEFGSHPIPSIRFVISCFWTFAVSVRHSSARVLDPTSSTMALMARLSLTNVQKASSGCQYLDGSASQTCNTASATLPPASSVSDMT